MAADTMRQAVYALAGIYLCEDTAGDAPVQTDGADAGEPPAGDPDRYATRLTAKSASSSSAVFQSLSASGARAALARSA